MVLGLIVSGISAQTMAFGGHGMMGGGFRGNYYNNQAQPGYNYQPMDLTEEQEEELAKLRDEYFAKTDELRIELRDINWEMRDLYGEEDSSEEFDLLEEKMNGIYDQLEEIQADHQEKVTAILTEEQLEELEENSYGQNFRGPGMMGYGLGMMGYGPGQMHNFMGNRFNSGFNRGFGMGRGFCY